MFSILSLNALHKEKLEYGKILENTKKIFH